jgi:hypothetical protein
MVPVTLAPAAVATDRPSTYRVSVVASLVTATKYQRPSVSGAGPVTTRASLRLYSGCCVLPLNRSSKLLPNPLSPPIATG